MPHTGPSTARAALPAGGAAVRPAGWAVCLDGVAVNVRRAPSTLDATVGQRTGPYVALIIISVALAIGAVMLQRSLTARLGTWNAALTAIGAYVATAAAVGYLLPTVDETPADFPATVLYDFRLASIGGQVVLWAVVGVVFGTLVDDRSSRQAETLAGQTGVSRSS